MTAVEKDRRGVLDEILGKFRKTEGDDGFAVFAAHLEKIGINRKEFTPRMKGLLEDMLADAKVLAAKFTDDETVQDEMAQQYVAMLMGKVANADAEEVVEETEPEMAPEDAEVIDEIMQEEGEEDDEEDEEFVAGKELILSLAAESNATFKAIQEVIPAIIHLGQFAENAAPLIEQVKDVPELQAKVKALETALARQKAMTPRQASKATETIPENDSKLQDAIDDIRKGTEGDKVLLGLRMKS